MTIVIFQERSLLLADNDRAARPEYLKTYTEETESFGSVESIEICSRLAGVKSIDDFIHLALEDKQSILETIEDIVLYWENVKSD